jgi:hypothetical protein
MVSSRKKKCCQVTIFANSLGPEVLYNENLKGCFNTMHPWLKDLSWDDVFTLSYHCITFLKHFCWLLHQIFTFLASMQVSWSKYLSWLVSLLKWLQYALLGICCWGCWWWNDGIGLVSSTTSYWACSAAEKSGPSLS